MLRSQLAVFETCQYILHLVEYFLCTGCIIIHIYHFIHLYSSSSSAKNENSYFLYSILTGNGGISFFIFCFNNSLSLVRSFICLLAAFSFSSSSIILSIPVVGIPSSASSLM